ncbi:MAG: hypothetical protein QOC85_2305, partial [Streptomyces sp.]|nr:hypothetical protein [Streptomyces sp.]
MTQSPATPLPSPKERRRLREAKSLSQADVAAKVGVSRETVRSWESGRTTPRGRKREAYAKLLAAPKPKPAPPQAPTPVSGTASDAASPHGSGSGPGSDSGSGSGPGSGSKGALESAEATAGPSSEPDSDTS